MALQKAIDAITEWITDYNSDSMIVYFNKINRVEALQHLAKTIIRPGFNPTPEQAKIIYAFVSELAPNITVSASAGTGKTTLIRFIVAALNVVYKDDPMSFSASTCHGLAWYTVRNTIIDNKKASYKIDIDRHPDALYWIVYNHVLDKQADKTSKKAKSKAFSVAARFVQFNNIARSLFLPMDATIQALCDDINKKYLDDSGKPIYKNSLHNFFLNATPEELTAYTKLRTKFYSPHNGSYVQLEDIMYLYHNLPIVPHKKYEIMIVDESQDIHPDGIKWKVISDHTDDDTQFLFVGDEKQYITSWLGQASDALTQLTKLKNCDVYPMTLTYRNPTCINDLIEKYLGTDSVYARTHKTAKTDKGLCDYVGKYQQYHNGDMILARYNYLLIPHIIACIDSGFIPVCKAFDYIGEIKAIVKEGYKATNKSNDTTIQDRFEAGKIAKLKKLKTQLETARDYNDHFAAMGIEKELEEIKYIAILFNYFYKNVPPKGKVSINRWLKIVETYIANRPNKIYLYSFHACKGLESKRVIIIGGYDTWTDARQLKTDDGKIEAKNLIYVALTRTLHTIIIEGTP